MAWEETVAVIQLKDKKLPKAYLERVGRAAVNKILERTAKGLDKNGKKFTPYSDEYKSSDDFMLANKSQSTVNLKMMGEMLADLSVLSAGNGTIILGFPDAEQRAKANGHVTGKQHSGKLPVRDFLGVSDREIEEILARVPNPDKLAQAQEISSKKGMTMADIFSAISEVVVRNL